MWIVRQIALALAHAHQQGVLHRDVKPSNVLITASGRVLLFDFGLTLTHESPRVTREGVVGSPAYMAPEQIRGEEPNERTDTYALGVTLYELLALELPFLARNTAETQRCILQGEVVPLRHRNRAASWDVETVCLAAMERDPRRRYATAARFAEDLGHILAHRPIRARRAGVLLRMRRWAQRHPATTASIALGTLLVGGLPTGLWLQESMAAEAIREQRDRAERNLATAVDSVSHFLRRLANEELQFTPHMQQLASTFMQDALVFYEKLRAGGEADRRLTLEMAEGYRNMAWIQKRLGRQQKAHDAAREAVDLLEPEHARRPQDPDVTASLGNAWQVQGTIQRHLGRHDEAEANLRRAIELYAGLAAATEARVVGLYGEATCNKYLGAVLADGERPKEALTAYGRAIQILERLVEAFPEDREHLNTLAHSLKGKSKVLLTAGRQTEARPLMERAVEVGQAMLRLDADRPVHRYVLAECLETLSACQGAAGRQAGLEQLEQAVALLERLVQDFDSVVHYRDALARTLRNLGCAQEKMGLWKKALASFRRSQGEYRTLLAASDPAATDIRFAYVSLQRNLAALLVNHKHAKEAEQELQAALQVADKAASTQPLRPAHRYQQASCWSALATLHTSQGKFQEATAAFERARTVRAMLVEHHPDNFRYRLGLAQTLNNLGTLKHRSGNTAGAAAAFQEAVDHKRKLVALQPKNPALRHSLAGSIFNLGIEQFAAKQHDEAEHSAREALVAARLAVQGNPRRRAYANRLVDILETLAGYEQRRGDATKVFDVAEEMARRSPRPEHLVLAAVLLGRARSLIAEQPELAGKWSQAAMGWLQLAVEKGYAKHAYLAQSQALEFLRSRQDFQELLARMKSQRK
ncbi:MAG: protein kinase domain-containing protein [Planctomycetota bacterium]